VHLHKPNVICTAHLRKEYQTCFSESIKLGWNYKGYKRKKGGREEGKERVTEGSPSVICM
jgi:hypothetical protein